jgi:hypothetical protein
MEYTGRRNAVCPATVYQIQGKCLRSRDLNLFPDDP